MIGRMRDSEKQRHREMVERETLLGEIKVRDSKKKPRRERQLIDSE